MTYLITCLDNNRKSAVYTGGNIHGIYPYLEMIGHTTTSTTSGQHYHNFGPSSSINDDTTYLQPFIAAVLMKQKIICKGCGKIGKKADAYIIRGPKLLPLILIRNMNQFNDLNEEEPTSPPREWNS